MNAWIAVAFGGALGACARVALAGLWSGSTWPWGTFIVNVVGSLCIGLLWGLFAQAPWFQEWGRWFLVAGVLGAFTTFSAFSLESVRLMESGQWAAALGYIIASAVVCVAAAAAGLKFASLAH